MKLDKQLFDSVAKLAAESFRDGSLPINQLEL